MSEANPPNRPISYFTPGQHIGKYVVKRLLGRGGVAEVYRALNPDLDQDVAIKVLFPQVLDSPSAVAQFKREAQSVATLRHPNIVRVFDFHAGEPVSFMVMELIEGPTLFRVLRNYPDGMPQDLAIYIFSQLADAVAYAHDQGIIHRDIKPGNVLLVDSARPILTDFGLARAVGSSQISAGGSNAGTPSYMSPEMASGGEIYPASDIYSLGLVLYEMITGRLPFRGDTVASILMQHIQADPPPPSTFVPGLAPGIEAVIMRALEKNPASRYRSARDMVRELTEGRERPLFATVQLPDSIMDVTRSPDLTRRDTMSSRASLALSQTVSTM
ncbi:MAG TPA: serine/threonine-protein kinase, partial [Aggregatilineales bacterium]|nr:serine/threonine-protein kinase [Aggregatilineales bacterium]